MYLGKYNSVMNKMNNKIIKIINENSSSLEKVISEYIKTNMIYTLSPYKEELLSLYGNKQPLTLYRGMNFNTKEEFNNFIKNLKSKNYIENYLSAWTTNKTQAKQFAMTKPSYMEYMSQDNWNEIVKQHSAKERITGYIGIIIEIKIDINQGIDIRQFSSENEVILTAGKYKIINIQKIQKYKDLLKSKKDKLLDFFNDLDNDEFESAIKWLSHKNNQFLYDKEIINYIYNVDSFLLYNLEPSKLSNDIRHKLFLSYMKRIKQMDENNKISTYDYDNVLSIDFLNFGKFGWNMFLDNDIKTFMKYCKPYAKKAIDIAYTFYKNNLKHFPHIKWKVYNVEKIFQMSGLLNYYNQTLGNLIRIQWNKLQDKDYANKLFKDNPRDLTSKIMQTLKSLTLTEHKNFIDEDDFNEELEYIRDAFSGKNTEVLVHPTKSEITKMLKKSKYKELRGLIFNNTFYCWDSSKATHTGIRKGINPYSSISNAIHFAIHEDGIYPISQIDLQSNMAKDYVEENKEAYFKNCEMLDINPLLQNLFPTTATENFKKILKQLGISTDSNIITERVTKLSVNNSNIYITSSIYDLINYIKNYNYPRILIDKNQNLYIYGDAYNFIHFDLLKAAYNIGYYPNLKSTDELQEYTILNCIQIVVDDNFDNYNDRLHDSYDVALDFKDFIIYARDGGEDFSKTSLYKTLYQMYGLNNRIFMSKPLTDKQIQKLNFSQENLLDKKYSITENNKFKKYKSIIKNII